MKAYKFRSASQLSFALEIIFDQRLYCADWKTLNDPMEGMFAFSVPAGADRNVVDIAVQGIVNGKTGLRVCSLSTTFDCHLLWAHYAGGFDGLALEVEIPDDDPRARHVTYGGVFAAVNDINKLPDDIARDVLFSKYREWEYEREVRILQTGNYFDLPTPVQRVIVGHRMRPSVLRAIQIICEKQGIPLLRTGIGDEGIDADVIE
ncbi:DUF2971 domain-containing protein [Corallococcus sicarius]|uniref:DUF2971 domain-containing protein n=1 Tax=Corallococcus sicarius TaxID=2316726 RepID=A0A3A8MV01_9BACT|nr:DUF2971 domain-containing protein [Corallococcus sicarius]RKH36088.1 hypothetical protein D7X12_33240 [Corallococcus sicarius]